MLILRHTQAIEAVPDPQLRQLIQCSANHILSQFEPDEYTLDELVLYIVVEPGDSIASIEEILGGSIFGSVPELVVSESGWYQCVFVISDDGYGIEMFVPKTGIDPELLAMCSNHAFKEDPAQDKAKADAQGPHQEQPKP